MGIQAFTAINLQIDKPDYDLKHDIRMINGFMTTQAVNGILCNHYHLGQFQEGIDNLDIFCFGGNQS